METQLLDLKRIEAGLLNLSRELMNQIEQLAPDKIMIYHAEHPEVHLIMSAKQAREHLESGDWTTTPEKVTVIPPSYEERMEMEAA